MALKHWATPVLRVALGVFIAVDLASCGKEEQPEEEPVVFEHCNDLRIQLLAPATPLMAPCIDMYTDTLVVDSLDVDGDAVPDLQFRSSRYVVFPGGGGGFWTCWGGTSVSGIDSTLIVKHSPCSMYCQGSLGIGDVLSSADELDPNVTLATQNVQSCACFFEEPGYIGFIKQIDGHAHCGYVDVVLTTEGLLVTRSVFALCPDEPLVVAE